MKYPQILGFIATVSAIDAYFFRAEQGQCGGSGIYYQGVNPNVCYTAAGNSYLTVGYYGIPTDWTITAYAWADGSCTNIAQRGLARGTTNMCLGATGRWYTGTSYYFGDNGRRRARENVQPDTCAAEDMGCQQSRKPDGLILADGTKWSLEDVSGDELVELLELASNATTAADLPQHFQLTEA